MGNVIIIPNEDFSNISIRKINISGTSAEEILTTFESYIGMVIPSGKRSKLNILISNLINSGIWNKIEALYPFVGDNETRLGANIKFPGVLSANISQGSVVFDEQGYAKGATFKINNYKHSYDDFCSFAVQKKKTTSSTEATCLPLTQGAGTSDDSGMCIISYNNNTYDGFDIRTLLENAISIQCNPASGYSGYRIIAICSYGNSTKGQIVLNDYYGTFDHIPPLIDNVKNYLYLNSYLDEENYGQTVKICGFGRSLSNAEMSMLNVYLKNYDS